MYAKLSALFDLGANPNAERDRNPRIEREFRQDVSTAHAGSIGDMGRLAVTPGELVSLLRAHAVAMATQVVFDPARRLYYLPRRRLIGVSINGGWLAIPEEWHRRIDEQRAALARLYPEEIDRT